MKKNIFLISNHVCECEYIYFKAHFISSLVLFSQSSSLLYRGITDIGKYQSRWSLNYLFDANLPFIT